MPSMSPLEMTKRLGTIRGTLPLVGAPNTLSVCMIVKNEEKNIEAAVRSFLPFADEIVVNDTGSTDRTLEILSRLPVRVIQHPWEGDFSIARNQSLAAARCSWVIWMDADDRVPPESVPELQKLKTAPLDRCFGFQVINTQGGQPLGTRFYQTRMFPNHSKIRFERRVHEQIIYSVAALGLHSMFLDTAIWHTGYENPELKKVKAQRNIDLLRDDPDALVDPILPMQEGDSYAILEQWAESKAAYLKAYHVPHCKEIQKDAWMEIPNCIGRACVQLGEYAEAEEWYQKGIDSGSGKVEPLYFLGELYVKTGRPAEAIPLFKKAVHLQRKPSSVSNQYDVLRIHSFHQLCQLLNAQGSHAEALQYAEEFAREYPMINDSQWHKGRALLSLGKAQEAERFLASYAQVSRKKEHWEAYLAAAEARGAQTQELQRIKALAPQGIFVSESRPKLSVAMIVKNEEENLPGCLESLRGIWDELVIVDTGSTDRTVAIAESFGARVEHFAWIGDFSAARNVSLAACQGEWILWMDADDRLPVAEQERLRAMVQEAPHKAWGLMVKNTTDQGLTGSVFAQVRLFPNDPRIRFEGRVHEQVLGAIRAAGYPVEFSTLQVYHTGYLDDATVRAKQERNLELLTAEYSAEPQRMTGVKLDAIAGAHQDLGRYEEAISWYTKAEDRCRKVGEDPHILLHAQIKIAQCMAELGQWAPAAQRLEALVERQPEQFEALALLAQIYQVQGQEDTALRYWNRLFLAQEGISLIPVDANLLKFKASKALAEFLQSRGWTELAIEVLRSAKAIQEGQALHADTIVAVLCDAELEAEALDLLEWEARLKPSADNDLQRARLRILTGDVQGALGLLDAATRQYPMFEDLTQLRQMVRQDLGLPL
jgi:glycosyltransferase involved in cell wall biosynthesis/Tfp pilus assembly protein PilF